MATAAGHTKLSLEELKKGNLFIGTPMYGLQAMANYIGSMINLSMLCGMHGIPMNYYTMATAVISMGRNDICDKFFEDKAATHLMFIDADMGFEPLDVLYLKQLMTEDSPYDIMGASCTKKVIDWETVRQAVLKGKGAKDPQELELYTARIRDINVIFKKEEGTATISTKEPVEVEGLGTGFMMIKKSAMKTFALKYPDYRYYDPRSDKEIVQFFHADIAPDFISSHRLFLSEDNWFCNKAKNIGLKVWFCPWMKVTHMGAYTFKGNIIDTGILLNT